MEKKSLTIYRYEKKRNNTENGGDGDFDIITLLLCGARRTRERARARAYIARACNKTFKPDQRSESERRPNHRIYSAIELCISVRSTVTSIYTDDRVDGIIQ